LQVHQIELEMQNEELRRAREEVEAGLAKYSTLYNFSPVGYFTLDCNTAILQVNLTGASLLGLERSRLLKRRFDSFVAEESRPDFNAFLDQVFKSRVKKAFDIALRGVGNQPLYVRIEALADESAPECHAVVMDITERKQTGELNRLRMHLLEYATTHTLEEILRETLDQMGYLVGSPIGFYHFISPDQQSIQLQTWSTRTLKEFCSAEGPGLHYPMAEAGVWVDCIHQRKPVIHNDYATLAHKKGMPEGHAKLIRELIVPIIRNGNIVAIIGVGNKTTDYTQKDVEIITFIADVAWTIAERKRAEEALAKHAEMLKFVNTELESFSYSVSHDLRAPLRAIDGYARMILKKEGDKFDEDTKHKFNQIRNGTEMMDKLITDILSLSRFSRHEIRMVNVNMKSMIEGEWDKIKSANADREIVLVTHEIPPAKGDEALLRQIITNLLSNAVKFTKNVNTPSIEVGGYAELNENIYYIKDNGVGFDMEYYDKLFSVFQRLHSKEEFEGTGIGLAIVQRIINRHGGRVWAKGKVDEGATFYFALPS
jgi:PAS domain S-box-containing protein